MAITFKSYPGTGFRYFKQNKEHKIILREVKRVLKRSLLYLGVFDIYSVYVIKDCRSVFEWTEIAKFQNEGYAYKDIQGNNSGLDRRVKAWNCCRLTYVNLATEGEAFSYVVICGVHDDEEKQIIHVLDSSDQFSRMCFTKNLFN